MPNAKAVTEVKAASQEDRGVDIFIVSAETQDVATLPFITITSSIWLHLRICLIKMECSKLRRNPTYHYYCRGKFIKKPY